MPEPTKAELIDLLDQASETLQEYYTPVKGVGKTRIMKLIEKIENATMDYRQAERNRGRINEGLSPDLR